MFSSSLRLILPPFDLPFSCSLWRVLHFFGTSALPIFARGQVSRFFRPCRTPIPQTSDLYGLNWRKWRWAAVLSSTISVAGAPYYGVETLRLKRCCRLDVGFLLFGHPAPLNAALHQPCHAGTGRQYDPKRNSPLTCGECIRLPHPCAYI